MIVFDADIRPVIYGLVLCAFLGSALAAWDFNRYREKHELLSFVEKEITETMDHMPPSGDLIEEDYTRIIKSSFDDKMRLAFETSRNYEEMKEYYVIRKCSLDDIIKQAVRKYASQFIRTKNRLIYEGTDAVAVTDEKWLGFIVEQVLSNALKYTDGGCVSIEVKEEKDNEIILSIGDTGIGIARDDLPRIFEKGYTGYNGRADKKSTGIGLYLCRRIADKIGCTISAQSECGRGTTIRIEMCNPK